MWWDIQTTEKEDWSHSIILICLRSHSFFLTQIINDLKNKKNIGDTLVTTLDYDVQETAYEALGDRDGAVVVMEVKDREDSWHWCQNRTLIRIRWQIQWDDIVSDEQQQCAVKSCHIRICIRRDQPLRFLLHWNMCMKIQTIRITVSTVKAN